MSKSEFPLAGKIALVTGASRGLGKGAAIALGEAGATVYVTARTLSPDPKGMPGAVEETAADVTKAGGRGIAIQCDHADDEQAKEVIRKITESEGRLDILVNNVIPTPDLITSVGPSFGGLPFWESPVEPAWNAAVTIGNRSHYVMTQLAMPWLIENAGSVYFISASGNYFYNVSTIYGMGKAANEVMMRNMAFELNDYPVSVMTIWPGYVASEQSGVSAEQNVAMIRASLSVAWARVPGALEELSSMSDQDLLDLTESPLFAGRAIAALAADPNIKQKSGRVLSAYGVAKEYGFTDVNGKTPDGTYYRRTDCWPPLSE